MADGSDREPKDGASDAAARRAEEILARRARAVAATRAPEAPEGLEVLAFEVAGERYGLELSTVIQVLDARAVATLPGAPRWLLGAAVGRTGAVPVLDLRQRLGLEGGGLADAAQVVVVDHEGDVFGIAVERLQGRVLVPRAGLAAGAGAIRWVAPDRLALLDLACVTRGGGTESGRG
ncbi:MAG TPA: chemotaxis protein CheW [Anaeromyxobacter sp.]